MDNIIIQLMHIYFTFSSAMLVDVDKIPESGSQHVLAQAIGCSCASSAGLRVQSMSVRGTYKHLPVKLNKTGQQQLTTK